MKKREGQGTTSEKFDKSRSDRVQSAVEAAWGKPQPKGLEEATFGGDQKGHAYRLHVAPVVRDVAKALGTTANPNGFGKLVEELDAWEPENSHWERVKCLLKAGANELSDAMAAIGAEEIDDDFLKRAPDLARQRMEASKKTGPGTA